MWFRRRASFSSLSSIASLPPSARLSLLTGPASVLLLFSLYFPLDVITFVIFSRLIVSATDDVESHRKSKSLAVLVLGILGAERPDSLAPEYLSLPCLLSLPLLSIPVCL